MSLVLCTLNSFLLSGVCSGIGTCSGLCTCSGRCSCSSVDSQLSRMVRHTLVSSAKIWTPHSITSMFLDAVLNSNDISLFCSSHPSLSSKVHRRIHKCSSLNLLTSQIMLTSSWKPFMNMRYSNLPESSLSCLGETTTQILNSLKSERMVKKFPIAL